jgi:hypothetical protein
MQFRKLRFCVMLAMLSLRVFGADQAKMGSTGFKPLDDPPGVYNLYALGTNVFSGSTPEGDDGFAALAKLGVKTIISVDGAKPDAELAKKHGLRYVHLPHGYDGISTNLRLQLARASEVLPGPVYVHCHHGKHRGPTAAAVLCMVRDVSWTAAIAEEWLKAAGTSTNYTGLYAVVRGFQKPSAHDLKDVSSDFPETANVSGLIETMVGIDDKWEVLKAVRAAGYLAPKDHPDISPANEALILWQHYREAQRLPDAADHGPDFIERLKSSEAQGRDAERLLRLFAAKQTTDIRAQLDNAFDGISKNCASCHKKFRDNQSKQGPPSLE